MFKSVELYCHYNLDRTVRVRVHLRDNGYPWISRSALRRAERRALLCPGDYLCTSDYPCIDVYDGNRFVCVVLGHYCVEV